MLSFSFLNNSAMQQKYLSMLPSRETTKHRMVLEAKRKLFNAPYSTKEAVLHINMLMLLNNLKA